MKRIILSAADRQGDVYWYDGQPFTGVGFERGDGRIIRPYQLLKGKITGPYFSICEEGKHVILRIDLEGASGDYEPIRYLGEPFTGMGYDFDKEFCIYEGFFGWSFSEAWWSKDGLMTQCVLDRDGFTAQCAWHENGKLKDYRIQASASFQFFIGFSFDGLLETLRLERGMLNALQEVAGKSKFFPIKNRSDFCKLNAAKNIRFMGDEIGDDFIQYLAHCGVLAGVQKLQCFSTKVENLSRSTLNEMPQLKELVIE